MAGRMDMSDVFGYAELESGIEIWLYDSILVEMGNYSIFFQYYEIISTMVISIERLCFFSPKREYKLK